MKSRNFTVANSAQEKLACVEALPDNGAEARLPVVFLCHGYAYYKEEDGIFTGIAERLAKKGYAVYYFDFSGCGESEGVYEKTSLTKLIGDLQAVIAEVSNYPYIDIGHLSLVGQSFGTPVVIAGQIPEVDRIVLCGSFADPYTLLKNLQDHFDEQGVSYRVRGSGKKTTIGSQFWTDLKTYDLPALIQKYRCPILFVHGAKDTTVPPAEMQPLHEVVAGHSEVMILPESDHGLEPERDKLFEAVERFFR